MIRISRRPLAYLVLKEGKYVPTYDLHTATRWDSNQLDPEPMKKLAAIAHEQGHELLPLITAWIEELSRGE